jgi:hypothetical protein
MATPPYPPEHRRQPHSVPSFAPRSPMSRLLDQPVALTLPRVRTIKRLIGLQEHYRTSVRMLCDSNVV